MTRFKWKAVLLAAAISLFGNFVPTASAETHTYTWSNPTTNTDDSQIPATGPGSLVSWRFEYGSCSSPGVFGTKSGEFKRDRAPNGPALTSATNNFTTPGSLCSRVLVTNTYGVESDASNVAVHTVAPPKPKSPTLQTVAPQVFDVRPNESALAWDRGEEVGSIGLGEACDDGRCIDADYCVPERQSVVRLTRTPASGALVAKCGPAS